MYDVKKVWPKWNIVKTIGEGSFGKVFEIARNEYGIEEHSALKVISIPQSESEIQSLKNDGMTDSDTTEYFKGIVNDFVQEIQLMTRLKGSTNVVGYEDFAVIEKNESIGFEILIRMELLTALPNYLRENHFRVYDVIRLGIDMCKALEVCREYNIVHRDIKPDNIFISSKGEFKLGDFGVARTIEKTMAGLSRKGTYSYMAPEIYNGNEYGFEADIYSLGIVLYKLVNNNRDPFLPQYPAVVKYNDKMEAMVKRIQGLELPKPVNADENLARIIFKACAHNPNDRYSHPKDFRLELESIAMRYADLQSEVFSENGINYYTNSSFFEPVSLKVANNNIPAVTERSGSGEAIREDVDITVDTTVLEEKAESDEKINPCDQPVVLENSVEEAVVDEVAQSAEKSVQLCPKCNAEINPDGRFCGNCGYNFKEVIEDNSVVCPTCGHVMEAGVKFCAKCGGKIEQIVEIKEEIEAPIEEKAVVCANCGCTMEEGVKFCAKCGNKIEKEEQNLVVCSNCGHAMEQGVKFCANCGSKL